MSDNKPTLGKNRWDDPSNLNRAYQKRRDNDIIKIPEINFWDIDYAILHYLREVISPTIDENGTVVDVPVMYANGETWSQIKELGFIRDTKNKVKTPLIIIHRSNAFERADVRKLEVNNGGDNRYYIKRFPRNLENRNFRLNQTNNTSFGEEFYISLIPRHYKITYDIQIWTEYEEDMNQVVQSILPQSGHAWGDTLLFPTFVGDFNFDTLNAPDQERLVISNTSLTVDGYLVNAFDLRKSNIEKAVSIKRVMFRSEREVGTEFYDNQKPVLTGIGYWTIGGDFIIQ